MLDMTIFAEYTIQDILTWAGIAIGILIAISILKKIFRPEKVDPYMQIATCSGCGWQGQARSLRARISSSPPRRATSPPSNAGAATRPVWSCPWTPQR